MIIGYGKDIDMLAADLDLKLRRSELIASNIANVDTPGYKAKDLTFHHILADNMRDEELSLKRTDVKHMTEGEPAAGMRGNEVVEEPNPDRPDGNNVNIDQEMLKLTENNIQYNVSVQLLSKRLRQISDAIESSK